MRQFSYSHLQVVYLVNFLLVSSDTKPNTPISTPVAPQPSLADKCDALYGNKTIFYSLNNASTEDRLEADGFHVDTHVDLSLENDLTTKLKTIYSRVYELADKLEETLAYTCELTHRLKKTQDELRDYTRNENQLIERLKKTEVFVTILLKKSHVEFNQTKEEVDTPQNITLHDAVRNESNTYSGKKGDNERNYTACNLTMLEQRANNSCNNGTLNDEADPEEKNPSLWQNILAKIGFKFVLKRPTEPILMNPIQTNKVELRNDIRKTGPLLRNITLLVNDFTDVKRVADVNVSGNPYDEDLGQDDWFETSHDGPLLRDFDLGDSHHHNTQYRYSKGDTGPPGSPGLPGVQGAAGPAGAAGAVGAPGAVGPKGEPGIGIPGTNGIPGTQGVAGQTGLTGAPGNPGVPGIQGVQGPQGDQGPIGLTGPPGDKGDKGTIG